MFEALMTILSVVLFAKGVKLAFKMTWGITKIIATVLLVCAVPALVLGLIFAGGLLLLLPVGLIAGAILLLKFL